VLLQRQSRFPISRIPTDQGCVALLRLVPLRLKAPKPTATDFEPRTLGEHIKRRRLMLKMTKRQAAVRLGVGPETVRHWESGETNSPSVVRIPAILEFLCYDPFVEPGSIPDRLRAMRRRSGWSIRKAAAYLGVDPTTWGDWEHGKVILFRTHRVLVARLLGLPEDEVDRVMAVGWRRAHK
jgi:transcriptional regulator with XRE-family HTH domain